SGALAHELRNPLSAAKGLLQLMGRRRDPDKMKGYSDLVLKELERVTRLLNEFLLLGKPADLDPEPLDLVIFIEELVPLFEGETLGTDIEIKLNLERVPLVKADPGQLTQVVLNLVRNAIQAVGQKGYFSIAVKDHPDGVVLEVKDSGPGLTSEAQEKIFRPFFTTKERGTGLGLPIVQAIIHNHGGRISAANDPGGGAVFTIILPALEDRYEEVDVLLVIEDDILRYPAEQALRLAGIKVISTGNEHGLNELLMFIKPQIIVLDENIFEDKVDGLIKDLAARAKIIILGQPGEIDEGLDYISRPLRYDIFISKIHYMLNDC
ncbi:MAG: ATP-binding protein, partial [Desulfotomaculaceae bacterium]